MTSKLRPYVKEHQKKLGHISVFFTYTYNVQIHGASNLPPFSLLITRLLPKPTANACALLSYVSGGYSLLAYQLRFMHRIAILDNMADKKSRKMQA